MGSAGFIQGKQLWERMGVTLLALLLVKGPTALCEGRTWKGLVCTTPSTYWRMGNCFNPDYKKELRRTRRAPEVAWQLLWEKMVAHCFPSALLWPGVESGSKTSRSLNRAGCDEKPRQVAYVYQKK
jgi:hypothetical protein